MSGYQSAYAVLSGREDADSSDIYYWRGMVSAVLDMVSLGHSREGWSIEQIELPEWEWFRIRD
jgi:hypothetical protein